MSNRQHHPPILHRRPMRLGHMIVDASRQARIYRAPCIGGCGRETLHGEECRHCRKARILKGRRVVRRVTR